MRLRLRAHTRERLPERRVLTGLTEARLTHARLTHSRLAAEPRLTAQAHLTGPGAGKP
ncbi:hypothetical protein [Kitasatospora azatica]|uniref:hypothetical protein n=1 Tax=Kitasatospora azatica TaxID=58347 RepID=UPI000B23D519|nr:hypothetical protein [Kitasatospora azatica]